MPVYLITPLADNATQAKSVIRDRLKPTDFYELQNESGWLIYFRGTSVELSNHLGVTGFPDGGHPTLSSILITSIGSYYGRGPSDMWEWLKTRFEGMP